MPGFISLHLPQFPVTYPSLSVHRSLESPAPLLITQTLAPLPALVLSGGGGPGRWSFEKLPGDLNVRSRFKTTDLNYYVCGAIIGFLSLTHFEIICMCFFVYVCVHKSLTYQYLPIIDPIIYLASIRPYCQQEGPGSSC